MCFWYCSQEKYSMILLAGTGILFKRLNWESDIFIIDLFGNTLNYLLCLKVVSQNSRRVEEQRGKWNNTWAILKFFSAQSLRSFYMSRIVRFASLTPKISGTQRDEKSRIKIISNPATWRFPRERRENKADNSFPINVTCSSFIRLFDLLIVCTSRSFQFWSRSGHDHSLAFPTRTKSISLYPRRFKFTPTIFPFDSPSHPLVIRSAFTGTTVYRFRIYRSLVVSAKEKWKFDKSTVLPVSCTNWAEWDEFMKKDHANLKTRNSFHFESLCPPPLKTTVRPFSSAKLSAFPADEKFYPRRDTGGVSQETSHRIRNFDSSLVPSVAFPVPPK